MKDYRKDLDNFDYGKKYIPSEHKLDFLYDYDNAKKFEQKEHASQLCEVDEDVFKTLKELITPRKGDVILRGWEITGQYEANPPQQS